MCINIKKKKIKKEKYVINYKTLYNISLNA